MALATQAAAQGLTVAEYQDQTNAGRTPIKVAVERFLKLHRNDRPKTVKQYNLALTHLLANLPRGVRFIKDLATSDALDTYVQRLQTEQYATWDDIDGKHRKYHVTGDGKEDVNFVPKITRNAGFR